MEYRYITENNLEDRQKYTYSQYGGDAFLSAYEKSRRDGINSCIVRDETVSHETYPELMNLFCQIHNPSYDIAECIPLADAYMKSFEVRKRLYCFYSNDWKPVISNGGGVVCGLS